MDILHMGWWFSSCCGSVQTTGGASQSYSRFDSRWLQAFSLSSISTSYIQIPLVPVRGKMLWAFRVRKTLSISSFLLEYSSQSLTGLWELVVVRLLWPSWFRLPAIPDFFIFFQLITSKFLYSNEAWTYSTI